LAIVGSGVAVAGGGLQAEISTIKKKRKLIDFFIFISFLHELFKRQIWYLGIYATWPNEWNYPAIRMIASSLASMLIIFLVTPPYPRIFMHYNRNSGE